MGWRPLNQETSGEEKRDVKGYASPSDCASKRCFPGSHMAGLYFRHWTKPALQERHCCLRQDQRQGGSPPDAGWGSRRKGGPKPSQTQNRLPGQESPHRAELWKRTRHPSKQPPHECGPVVPSGPSHPPGPTPKPHKKGDNTSGCHPSKAEWIGGGGQETDPPLGPPRLLNAHAYPQAPSPFLTCWSRGPKRRQLGGPGPHSQPPGSPVNLQPEQKPCVFVSDPNAKALGPGRWADWHVMGIG